MNGTTHENIIGTAPSSPRAGAAIQVSILSEHAAQRGRSDLYPRKKFAALHPAALLAFSLERIRVRHLSAMWAISMDIMCILVFGWDGVNHVFRLDNGGHAQNRDLMIDRDVFLVDTSRKDSRVILNSELPL
jgi:hypothetical protein